MSDVDDDDNGSVLTPQSSNNAGNDISRSKLAQAEVTSRKSRYEPLDRQVDGENRLSRKARRVPSPIRRQFSSLLCNWERQ